MPGWLRDGSVGGEICFDKMDGGSVIASEIALGAQHPGGREGKHVEGGPQKVLLSFLKLTVKERVNCQAVRKDACTWVTHG